MRKTIPFYLLSLLIVIVARTDDLAMLERGKVYPNELKQGQTQTFQIELKSGEFAHVVVTQKDIDLVVTLLNPEKSTIKEVDSSGPPATEVLKFVAEKDGSYAIHVSAFNAQESGKYEIQLEARLSPQQYQEFLAKQKKQRAEVQAWASREAIRLKTVEAGNGYEDLRPLKDMIGKARIVQLGEATHGTREFFQLKHRMLEFLVEEMGFNVFAIEATMPEAFDINEYVLTGKGDPEKALSSLYFWVWNTEEVLTMIRWMRVYNADEKHVNKVKFYGFDMQFSSRAAREVHSYFQKVETHLPDDIKKLLNILTDPYLASDWQIKGAKDGVSISEAMLKLMDVQKSHYSNISGLKEFDRARQMALIIHQCLKIGAGDSKVRDQAMAENILWILKQEGPAAKMAVWAHNLHVTYSEESGIAPMGSYLKKALGDEILTFGFAFNQGSFQAQELPFPSKTGLRKFTVAPAPEGSLDRVLAEAGLQIAALNLTVLQKQDSVAEWFSEPQGSRLIGAGFSQDMEFTVTDLTFPKNYDAIFFVEKTSEARANQIVNLSRKVLESPKNLDFEENPPGQLPNGWLTGRFMPHFDFEISTLPDGMKGNCILIHRNPGQHYGEVVGQIYQILNAAGYHGKKIRFQIYARAEPADLKSAGYLWFTVRSKEFGPKAYLSYDGMSDRPIRHSEWKKYTFTAQIPKEAIEIEYGAGLSGNGSLWIDSANFEIMNE